MPAASLPLASYCQFASNNFEAMHRRLSELLKPHRLRRLSNVPVSGIICRATLKRVSVNLMRIGPAVDVWPGALDDFYLVQIPIRGAVQISLGEDRVRCEGAMAAVISPGEQLRARWSDNCAQLILQIPRETLETRLAERIGGRSRDLLRFEPAFDLRRPAARDWRALLNFTVRSIDRGGLFSSEPLGATLEDLLLEGL
jgi:AraC-binding-like domain